MDAELIRIRRNKQQDRRMDGNIYTINQQDITEKCLELNANMTSLYNLAGKPGATIDEYVEKLIQNIYIILEMFNEMGVYPDYFYDIFFRVNDEYRTRASRGEVNGRESLYNIGEYAAKISLLMEKGIQKGNYQLNPTKIKSIGEYYNEMVDFLHKHYLPYEVKTVDMCREMFYHIYIDANGCINNNLGSSLYASDDIETLSRLLFDYILFFGAIGVNPKKALDEYINNQKELGKSK